jgi:hypothetical protein
MREQKSIRKPGTQEKIDQLLPFLMVSWFPDLNIKKD